VVHDGPTDADGFADVVLRYSRGSEASAASALAGKGDGGFPAPDLKKARDLMSAGAVIITTQSLYNATEGSAALQTLSALGELSCYGLAANDQGAKDLGMVCDLGTHSILSQCAAGELEGLWLLGSDPFDCHPEKDLIKNAVENVGFLVVQSHSESEAYHYASVVLPMAAPAEMDGTYTNIERRVQRMDQVLPTKGEAKPAWRVFSELALRMNGERPFFNVEEILAEIGREYPAFAGISFNGVQGEGQILGNPRQPAAAL
jgi:anaerobic selenocysteine-containing dehydrogenase